MLDYKEFMTGLHGTYKAALEKDDLICELLLSGQPLIKICHCEDMQGVPTVMSRLWDNSPHTRNNF